MKTSALLIALLIPTLGQAKVSEFNALIKENVDAQNQLHQELKQNMDETKTALQDAKTKGNIVWVESSSYNVQPNKGILKFRKEVKAHQPSNKRQFQRLVHEFSSMDKEF